jgi:UDP-glucose 4-epimerase
MKTPVLITGGCGYIGSHIVHNLRDAGYQPIVIDNLSNSRSDLLPEDVPFYQQDVNDTAALKNVLQKHDIKTVIHMAAFLSVEESVSFPLKYYQNNVGGTCSLLDACLASGVKKLIFSSTGAVYSSSEEPISETDITEPSSPYGLSKLMAEKVIRDVTIANDLHAVVLRYFNVAGADLKERTGQQGIKATHLIARACQAANGDAGEMKIFGDDYETVDGTCVRDYIHVSDLAEIHRVVMEQNFTEKFKTFNCGYGMGSSVKQVVDRVRDLTGKNFTVNLTHRRPGDLMQTVANNSRLLTETKWRPQYNDLDTMIKTAWNWYQKEADLIAKA